MRRLGEIALISDYLAPLAKHPGSFGLKDDAALLTGIPAAGLVVTADGLVAGVHFFEEDDPGGVAYKALAVNVSDLAAKAARPEAYTLTLALPDAPTEAWARRFAEGLSRAQDRFGIGLIGGDTVTARGAWWLAITAFGAANARGMVHRSGARAGDVLYVSGTVGDAALGLLLRLKKEHFGAALTREQRDFLLARYLLPEPRIALSEALAAYASAAMDVSDGLGLDLSRMCAASGIGAEVAVAAVPLSNAARAALSVSPDAIETLLSGGDDYEILACVPPDRGSGFEAECAGAGVPVTRIGTMVPGAPMARFTNPDGSPFKLESAGFEHFKQ